MTVRCLAAVFAGLTALGTVVFVVPNMGMEVAFRTVESTQSAVLQKWLAELG